jgi:GNAT superfamily N-acetyltransferase
MAGGDVLAAADVFLRATTAVHVAHDPTPQDPAEMAAARERLRARIAHMLGTDPEGAWVAVTGDRVVGMAQAIRRETLWILSLLGVEPGHQDAGTGKALLEQALAYGDRTSPGLIFSSPDPRAMRRYLAAGFAIHPCVEVRGVPASGALVVDAAVREGDISDLAVVAAIDRRLRGAAHGVDTEHLLGRGARLRVLDERGYSLVEGSRLLVLGATDEQAARTMLRATLASMAESAHAEGGSPVLHVEWLTAAQQWAFEVCSAAGMAPHSMGAVMVRGTPGPLTPYVPSGGLG